MKKTLLLLITLSIGLLQARTITGTVPMGRIYDKKWLDINAWKVPFYNDGRYGINTGVVGGDRAGGSWPQPLVNAYIFGAGVWIGCLQDTVDAEGKPKTDTLVTFSYNPNSGLSEMVPGDSNHYLEAPGSQLDRIYRYPGDWPPPRARYAPDANDTVFVPQKNFSLQDLWCVYTDVDPNRHTPKDTRPIGINVYQTVYAWNYTANKDIFFLKYDIKNVSGRPIRKMYLGAVIDPDIGDSKDDLVGLIKDKWFKNSPTDSFEVKNVGFAYDYDNREKRSGTWDWDKGTPGCIAYKFLDGPIKEKTGEPVMTAFKRFTLDFDPPKDPARYMTMAGYDYRTNVYNPFDSLDPQYADKRFIQASGPFDLEIDSSATIIVAVIAASFGKEGETGAKKDTLELAKVAATAQFIYDQHWLLPGPPPSPNLTLIPGDKVITLTWNNLSEITPDPYYIVASDPGSSGYNPFYLPYDFEGYKVFKSEDGTNWQLLTQCDLKDGVVYAETSRVLQINPNGDTVVIAETIGTDASDRGIFYTYVDSSVANGFPYYYAITAYDHNYDAVDSSGTLVPKLLITESGKVLLSAIPRSNPERIVPPDTIVVTQTVGDSLRAALKDSAFLITAPYLITGDVYELRFIEPDGGWVTYTKIESSGTIIDTNTYTQMMPFYRYYIYDLTKGDTALPLTSWMYNFSLYQKWQLNIPQFDGINAIFNMQWTVPDSRIETIVAPASYTGTLKEWKLDPASWAYRGSDYKLTWHPGANPALEVWDVTNNRAVPYTSYAPQSTDTTDNLKKANGWNFSFIGLSPSKTLRSMDKAIYISGVLVLLNGGQEIGSHTGEIHDGDVWTVKAPASAGLAPTGNVFRFDTQNSVLKFDTQPLKLAVRVVPNPYLITNSWEKSTVNRVLAFTHLPNECTIRIFNIAGDLVKVIHHRETTGRYTDPTLPVKNDLGGTENWNIVNDNNQLIATGVYIFHVQSAIGEQVGKFIIVR
jgi:hypothetical protein